MSKVEKDTYKYFKYPLKPVSQGRNTMYNTSYMEEFTIELQEFLGACNLFFSFEEKNPKSENDYGKESDTTAELEENFFEDEESYMKARRSQKSLRKDKRQVISENSLSEVQKSKFYTISNPTGSDTLYFSLVGLEEENSVQVLVYNRTTVVNETTTVTTPSVTTTNTNENSGKAGIDGKIFNLTFAIVVALVFKFF